MRQCKAQVSPSFCVPQIQVATPRRLKAPCPRIFWSGYRSLMLASISSSPGAKNPAVRVQTSKQFFLPHSWALWCGGLCSLSQGSAHDQGEKESAEDICLGCALHLKCVPKVLVSLTLHTCPGASWKPLRCWNWGCRSGHFSGMREALDLMPRTVQ